MKYLKSIVLAVALITTTAQAQTPSGESKAGGFELGVALGFPAGLGIQLGYWGPSSLPLLARASLGLGTTVDLGVHLPAGSDPDNSLYLAATGGAIGYFGIAYETLFSLGPTVGVRLHNFFAQAGPCFYFDHGSAHFAAQGQVGFSVLY